MVTYTHDPVMLTEVIKYLAPRLGHIIIDGTLGGAGYTLALADMVGLQGRVISLDLDPLALNNAASLITEQKISNVTLLNGNFKNLDELLEEHFPALEKFSGLVLDLGLSSAQLADSERGFSFKGEHPLDMAFGPQNERSTTQIINSYPLLELTRIFREYGEERYAYQIAKAIVESRRTKSLRTTADLVTLIEKVVPFRFRTKIHPATRIFQALRMETNDELNALKIVLQIASKRLAPGGRLVVVSFHSGEDRIVKQFLKNNPDFQVLTKKPLIPTETEIVANPRARSAKLRAAQKI